jgi:hypothetical protein
MRIISGIIRVVLQVYVYSKLARGRDALKRHNPVLAYNYRSRLEMPNWSVLRAPFRVRERSEVAGE